MQTDAKDLGIRPEHAGIEQIAERLDAEKAKLERHLAPLREAASAAFMALTALDAGGFTADAAATCRYVADRYESIADIFRINGFRGAADAHTEQASAMRARARKGRGRT